MSSTDQDVEHIIGRRIDPITLDQKQAALSLNEEERNQLELLFRTPVFQKALNIVHQKRPSIFPSGSLKGYDTVESDRVLHRQQGWRMFELALLSVMNMRFIEKENNNNPHDEEWNHHEDSSENKENQ